jgi:hypothetical protein
MILENYESVAERIEKFWNHYLGIGRIDTELVYQDGTRYIVKAYGYRETTDLVPLCNRMGRGDSKQHQSPSN